MYSRAYWKRESWSLCYACFKILTIVSTVVGSGTRQSLVKNPWNPSFDVSLHYMLHWEGDIYVTCDEHRMFCTGSDKKEDPRRRIEEARMPPSSSCCLRSKPRSGSHVDVQEPATRTLLQVSSCHVIMMFPQGKRKETNHCSTVREHASAQ